MAPPRYQCAVDLEWRRRGRNLRRRATVWGVTASPGSDVSCAWMRFGGAKKTRLPRSDQCLGQLTGYGTPVWRVLSIILPVRSSCVGMRTIFGKSPKLVPRVLIIELGSRKTMQPLGGRIVRPLKCINTYRYRICQHCVMRSSPLPIAIHAK